MTFRFAKFLKWILVPIFSMVMVIGTCYATNTSPFPRVTQMPSANLMAAITHLNASGKYQTFAYLRPNQNAYNAIMDFMYLVNGDCYNTGLANEYFAKYDFVKGLQNLILNKLTPVLYDHFNNKPTRLPDSRTRAVLTGVSNRQAEPFSIADGIYGPNGMQKPMTVYYPEVKQGTDPNASRKTRRDNNRNFGYSYEFSIRSTFPAGQTYRNGTDAGGDPIPRNSVVYPIRQMSPRQGDKVFKKGDFIVTVWVNIYSVGANNQRSLVPENHKPIAMYVIMQGSRAFTDHSRTTTDRKVRETMAVIVGR